jgi:hypothetical protein
MTLVQMEAVGTREVESRSTPNPCSHGGLRHPEWYLYNLSDRQVLISPPSAGEILPSLMYHVSPPACRSPRVMSPLARPAIRLRPLTHPDLVRWRRPRGLLRWRQRHRGAVYHCMRPSSSMWCARPGELEIRSRPTRCPRALHDRVRALRHVDRCTRSACARSMRARVIPPERARRIKLPRARALLLRHATHRSTRCFAMRGLSLRTLPISFFPCAVAGWQAG